MSFLHMEEVIEMDDSCIVKFKVQFLSEMIKLSPEETTFKIAGYFSDRGFKIASENNNSIISITGPTLNHITMWFIMFMEENNIDFF